MQPADKIALFFDGVQKALGDEEVVGRHDGVDADGKHLGEPALAGHALVRAQAPVCDVFADARV